MRSESLTKLGGWSLIAATVLFAAVFSYLSAAFSYPDVLDRAAAEVLPRLLSLGTAGRAVWVLYGLVPLLLIPTAIGVDAAARAAAPRAVKIATIAAVLSAVAMMIGLLRWPSLQWQLAISHGDASPAAREAIAAVFNAANSYLGNFIGEFLGELFLNTFFLASTIALTTGQSRVWLRYAGMTAVAFGFVAMLRNAAPVVAPIAAVNNAVLPLWMLLMGGAMVRRP